MSLSEFSPSLLGALAFVFGLLWGSFLNVVIYRLPRGLSVVHPPSSCPSCGVAIKPWDNVPLFGYLLLHGRTRCCGTKMSPRYPVVEVLGGLLSLAVFLWLVRPLGAISVVRAAVVYVTYFSLSLGLLAAAFIDFEFMELPDSITLGGTLLGLATATVRGGSFSDAAVGAVAGFLGFAVVGIVWSKLRGGPSLGLGDAKLLALSGSFFELRGVLFVVLAGSIQGTLAAVVVYLLRGKIAEPASVVEERAALKKAAEEGDAEAKAVLEEDALLANEPEEGLLRARLPFGPFLILACFELLFFGPKLLGAVEGGLERIFGWMDGG